MTQYIHQLPKRIPHIKPPYSPWLIYQTEKTALFEFKHFEWILFTKQKKLPYLNLSILNRPFYETEKAAFYGSLFSKTFNHLKLIRYTR